MKENGHVIKKMVKELKFILTATSILVTLKTIKNMVKDSSSGSIFRAETQSKMILWNITKESGGEDYLMDMVSIRRSTVICSVDILKMVSSMEKELNISVTEITTKDSM